MQQAGGGAFGAQLKQMLETKQKQLMSATNGKPGQADQANLESLLGNLTMLNDSFNNTSGPNRSQTPNMIGLRKTSADSQNAID